jgi:hypothetical protein
MAAFPFSFSKMSDWYDDTKDDPTYFSNDQKLIATFIAPSEKYEHLAKRWLKKHKMEPLQDKSTGYKGAFIKQNVSKDAIRKIDFLKENKVPYPNGLYVVKQDPDHIFFVFPIEKQNQSNESIFAADHYSVPYIRSKKEIHMHVTNYIPDMINVARGSTIHKSKTILKDGVLLPTKEYDADVLKNLDAPIKCDILDLIRTYELAKGQDGGSGRGRVMKRKPQSKGAATRHISLALESILLQKKIKRLNIIGVKSGAEWHFIVDVIRRKNSVKVDKSGIVASNTEFAFKIASPTWAKIQKAVLRAIPNLEK